MRFGLRWMLAGLVIGAVLVAAVAAALPRLMPDLWSRRPVDVAAEVAGLRFSLPQRHIRAPGQRDGGRLDRLDLVATWPDFGPPDPPRPPSSNLVADRLVFLSLTPADDAPEPATRPSALYARFLEADAWSNPGGLLMRRFQPSSPYADEELFIDPPDGRRFGARCRKSPGRPDPIGPTCLWLLRDGALDVQVRFDPALLADWPRLEAGVREFLKRSRKP